MTNQDGSLMTIEQAATFAQVHKNTVRNWITSGQLPATRFSSRIIRISLTDLQAIGKSYQGGEEGQWATR
jgi:excisionase family DNA binding protein